MITFEGKGDFRKTNSFLERLLEIGNHGTLDKYGREGVQLLSAATPKDTGLASSSWSYIITRDKTGTKITWLNSDVEGGCNVAILIQYGHGVKGGGFVQGRDFINPAMQPLFDEMADAIWKEVSDA